MIYFEEDIFGMKHSIYVSVFTPFLIDLESVGRPF